MGFVILRSRQLSFLCHFFFADLPVPALVFETGLFQIGMMAVVTLFGRYLGKCVPGFAGFPGRLRALVFSWIRIDISNAIKMANYIV
ncbi:MAG: hypothetical protein AB7W16_12690 [Candidatus Obscuribacterales bacterium]